MLFRFEIGRKLAGLLISRPDFLSRGVTMACLKREGKQPVLNDKLARVDISSENRSGQDFMIDVGMKSS